MAMRPDATPAVGLFDEKGRVRALDRGRRRPEASLPLGFEVTEADAGDHGEPGSQGLASGTGRPVPYSW